MCHASCLGLKALKSSEIGLHECSEGLWYWDKQGRPPVCIAPGTLPCSDPSKAYLPSEQGYSTCLASKDSCTRPCSITWHQATVSPLKTPDTAHSGITRSLGVLDPLLRSSSSQVTSAHSQNNNTLLSSQVVAPRTEPSTLSLLCTEWSRDSYSLDPILPLMCPKSPIRRLQPRAHPHP